jgi:Fe-S cluster assembly protein SufB
MAISKEEKELADIQERDREARAKSADFKPVFRAENGPTEEVVRYLSAEKDEPEWMLDFRLDALKKFLEKPMPSWGPSLDDIDFENISYYVRPLKEPKTERTWDDVPDEMKKTYERLGVPQAEAEVLAGVANQWDSEVVFHDLLESLKEQGVVFLDMDSGLREHEDLVHKYFGTLIPAADNKFAALNSAFWSGGSYIYVPKGVDVAQPLQTYFRINSDSMMQAERTLIIADEGAKVSYFEGCLPAGEKISIGDKMVDIESVNPGDVVASQNGNPVLVKQIMGRKYDGELIKITPMSPENNFSVTPEHPVLSIPRKSVQCAPRKNRPSVLPEVNSDKFKKAKPEFISAKNLKKGDFLVFPKIKPPLNINLENNFSKELLTILGYYLAEGSPNLVAKKHKAISFCFHIDEKQYHKELRECLEKEFGTKGSISYQKEKNAAVIFVYSDQLYDLCIKHCSRGSDNKELSSDLMNLSEQKIEYLIEAYFKGDGNVCYRYPKEKISKMIRVSSVSEKLIFQIQEILARKGTYSYICRRKGGDDFINERKITRRDQFCLSYTPAAKFKAVRQDDDYFYVPVRKVEKKQYSGAVFNLECDSPNSYLAKGFTVHNCSAASYSAQDSLHAAVVELIALPGAEINYFTAQNWDPRNVWNLVTKRARAEENATVRWVQGELGSKVNLKYPSVYLMGEGAHAEILSVAFAGEGQNQDTGGKAIHVASNTSSQIISKSISSNGGVASYRGLLEVAPSAENIRSRVVCDALILDDKSASNTWPTIRIGNPTADVGHEATVSKVGEEQMFYLMSRGISEAEAQAMIVNGFIESVVKEMPMEYAVEINRLIELQMEGSIG